MIAQSVGCSHGCSQSQREAGEPTVRWCFQAQRWPFEGLFGGPSGGVGAGGGPEQLIKMAGGGRRSLLSVECDDDLAVGAALLDVGQRVEGLVKWEGLVDDRAEVAGVVEGGQLAQLGTVGLHEQE
jgi:hypothetical protein